MSNDNSRLQHSRRRHRDESAVKKQTKIAKAYGVPVTEPHKFAKHHALNCGNPGCVMCSNPRKTFNEPSIQERRFDQDVDKE
jgi:hypothetical protein